MRRPRIAALLLATFALTGTTVALAPAASGGGFPADQELVSTTENLWRVFYVAEDVGCGTPEFFVTATINGVPVEPLAQQVESARSIIVTMPPEGPPGDMGFVIMCGSSTSATEEAYGIVTVDKVVDGVAPGDATFVVHVACGESLITDTSFGGADVDATQSPGPFAVDLRYDRSGGRAYVYSDAPRECEVTEPRAAGATGTTIDPSSVLLEEPTDFAVTVTNSYAPAPVEVVPTFTG